MHSLIHTLFFFASIAMVHIQPTTSLTATISVNELLSSCVDACLYGCAEIRAVQQKRQDTGGLAQTSLKDAGDPKSALTEADGAAQAAIVQALVKEWGNKLEIIGEEDDEDERLSDTSKQSEATSTEGTTTTHLRRNLCREILAEGDTVLLKDVTIFVDPLDGTREYVENRLSNCQSLIGITVHRKPVAGVIGIPFPDGTLDLEPTIVYGHVGAGHGVCGTPLMKSNANYEHLPRPLVASGDSKASVMVTGRELALEGTYGSSVLYGGAGNKILATAAGHVDCTLQHRYGGPWDTCAPEAVLRAMGGRITTWTGEDITVTYKDAPSYTSNLGYVATGPQSAIDHDKLIAKLRGSSVVQDYLATVQFS